MNVTRRTAVSVLAAALAVPAGRANAASRTLDLDARPGLATPVPNRPIRAWTYGGSVPGPLIRIPRGETLSISFRNRLAVPTAIHWHGLRIANAMDGTGLTQKPVAPGGVFDYVLTPPDAGTFWYHSLVDPSRQREMGLYGMLIVEDGDREPDILDVPFILDDWLLGEGGEIDEQAFGQIAVAAGEGRIGNRLTVNGADRPVLGVEKGLRARVRMLNASNARIAEISFSDGTGEILAIDGQPCAPTLAGAAPLRLGPGQRVDVLFAAAGPPISFRLRTAEGERQIATLARDPGTAAARRPAKPLPRNAVADYFNVASVVDVAYTIQGGRNGGLKEAKVDGVTMPIRDLVKRGLVWAVNGQAGLGPEPLFSVKAGVTVALTVDNITRLPQVLHIHGHAAWLIERAGRKLDVPVWHDTFIAYPLEPVKLLFIADNPGRWLVASTVAEHFAGGCRAWFEVRP